MGVVEVMTIKNISNMTRMVLIERYLLKMVLKSYIEVKSIPSVSKTNAYKCTASCWKSKQTLKIKQKIKRRKCYTNKVHKQSVHSQVLLMLATLTILILDAEHKVTAGVTDGFNCNARKFLYWCLGKQFPCWTKHLTFYSQLKRTLKLWWMIFSIVRGILK